MGIALFWNTQERSRASRVGGCVLFYGGYRFCPICGEIRRDVHSVSARDRYPKAGGSDQFLGLCHAGADGSKSFRRRRYRTAFVIFRNLRDSSVFREDSSPPESLDRIDWCFKKIIPRTQQHYCGHCFGTVFTSPIVALTFGELSLVAPLSNLLMEFPADIMLLCGFLTSIFYYIPVINFLAMPFGLGAG